MARTPSLQPVRAVVAVLGADSLLGKEIQELFESGPAVDVKLIASGEDQDADIIAAGRDEPVLIHSLKSADLRTAKVLLLAGTAESSRQAYQQIQQAKPEPLVIDVTGELADLPASKLRAPMVEAPGLHLTVGLQVIAHPAAIAIALFLSHLRKAGAIRRSVLEIFEPVSERGKAGIDELQKQTVALLSFKPLPKDVFDTQVSFNLAPEYGSESPHSLKKVELRIDGNLASLLAAIGGVPMPSLRVIHVPVFHAYSISAWVEFEETPGPDAIVESLAAANIDVRVGDQEPPSNVGVAGQSGITVGAIAPDRNHARAFWFWLAADNLRIAAENAVEVAREVLK